MSKDADNLDAPIRRESSPMIIKQDHGGKGLSSMKPFSTLFMPLGKCGM